jgi:hypothetical protein
MKKQKLLLLVVTIAIIFLAASANAELIGWWNFDMDDAGAGGVRDYATENGSHNGTISGSGVYSTDVPTAIGGGHSLDLTVTGSSVTIDTFLDGASDDDLDTGAALSISLWVKGWDSTSGTSRIIDKRASKSGYQIKAGANNLATLGTFNTSEAEFRSKSTTNVAGNRDWTHYAATFDGTTGVQKVYVDGVLEVTTTTANPIEIKANTKNLIMCDGVEALIDDVSIWNIALTSTDVAMLANGTVATTIPEPATLALLGLGGLLLRRKRRMA